MSHQTPARVEQKIVRLRRKHQLGPARVAGIVGVPASTVHRVLVRHGVNRLKWMDRTTGRVIRRIETDRCGASRTPSTRRVLGPGGRLVRPPGHRDRTGLADNGNGYRSIPWRERCAELGIKHTRTKPHHPATNGKVDCFRTREPVLNHHLSEADSPWPRFSEKAIEAGIRSVHALPLRPRETVIGALNLFQVDQADIDQADVDAARALADAATIATLQHRATIETSVVNDQLQPALNTRVVNEQAKGILTERSGLGMDQAFATLRSHARSQHLRLSDIAEAVIAGDLTIPQPASM